MIQFLSNRGKIVVIASGATGIGFGGILSIQRLVDVGLPLKLDTGLPIGRVVAAVDNKLFSAELSGLHHLHH